MGKIYVIGIGPGDRENLTFRAAEALTQSEVIIGYSKYIECIKEWTEGKEVISSAMRQELDRCILTVEKAKQGKIVALVSGGDSGIYGMAGVLLQVAQKEVDASEIEIIPGITSASASAALLGAPLMHDFALISLSDLLTPWEKIEKRIHAAAEADFVICIYNPKSKNRPDYINRAADILKLYKNPTTSIGIVRNAGRPGQTIILSDLQSLKDAEIDMFSTVIIGNSMTYIKDGKMITPRGYLVDTGGRG